MSDSYDATTGEIIAGPATHRWSEPCADLFAALAKAQSEIKNATKESQNPHFKSRYADLAAVREACWAALTKHGIGVVQMPINGTGSNIGIVTLLTHSSGQWIESTLFVAPTKFDAQGAGSVITYLRRYALAAMAGVAPDDDDGEAAVGRPSEGRAAQEGSGGTRPYPQRQQAAPAPSDAKAEASKRWKEIARAIDEAQTVPDLKSLVGSLAWNACDKAIRAAETTAVADEAMGKLDDRIAARKELLLLSGERA